MSKFLFLTKSFNIEPLGIMYLSSALKKRGHETSLVTLGEDFVDRVKEFAPDFIGYSIMTGDYPLYDSVNRKLKSEIDFVSVAGGPHPTFFPDCISSSSFDAICRGEADSMLAEFVSRYGSGHDRVPNFWVKGKDGICKNDMGSLIHDLDTVPFPDRGLVYDVDDRQRDNPIKHFIASRGCPYNCTYCFNHSYNRLYKDKGKMVRFRSVDNLLDEVEDVVSKYPTRFVYFQDDTFILKKPWVEEFSKKYSQRVNLPFHCHVRANLVDEDIVRLLKQANCYSVHIAVESGNERLRNEIMKRSMSEDEVYNACGLLRKYDIKFMLQNILGLPTSKLENDFETLEMNIKCKPAYAWASIFQPYPGTELARLCLEKKLISEEDFGKISDNFFDSSVLKLDNKKEVEYLQKLFALSVNYPIIYHSGLLKLALGLPDSPKVRGVLNKIYKSFRKSSDEKLYGFKL